MEVKWVIIITIATVVLAFFLGLAFGKKSSKQKIDGQLVIGTVEDRDRFEFVFSTELEDLQNQKLLTMEIIKTQNSQLL